MKLFLLLHNDYRYSEKKYYTPEENFSSGVVFKE